MKSKYAVGLDFGTLSVRALLVDIYSGEEVSTCTFDYPHGVMERNTPAGTWALQDPQDYLDGLTEVIQGVMQASGVSAEEIVGIGIDVTATTMIAVDEQGNPLCMSDEFRDEPQAYIKLWKHHGAEAEAEQILKLAQERQEDWLKYYGGVVSSEWMLPKILETLHFAPKVYEKARFMEVTDWLVMRLTGKEVRAACGAGYKLFYRHGQGYPSREFLRELDPRLENLVEEKLNAPLLNVGDRAGELIPEMADLLGLLPGTPVAAGFIDAHASVLAAGITSPGTMMIIVGTSSCHLLLSEKEIPVPGVGGLVYNGILPGYYGYEAGQSCVGDHFRWFTHNCVPAEYHREAEEKGLDVHQLLTEKLHGYRAGDSGLLALDWFNGVRTPLADFDLNGLILGMNLMTKPEEIYLALIEATAYGTRWILEQFEETGVHIDNIVLSGGIPAKNRMLVQVYSDVCHREIRLCGTSNASGYGAALVGISAASPEYTGYTSIAEIAGKLGKKGEEVFTSDPQNAKVYNGLYNEYRKLAGYFGNGQNDVMKYLNTLRKER